MIWPARERLQAQRVNHGQARMRIQIVAVGCRRSLTVRGGTDNNLAREP
jgi:hypothetical protein